MLAEGVFRLTLTFAALAPLGLLASACGRPRAEVAGHADASGNGQTAAVIAGNTAAGSSTATGSSAATGSSTAAGSTATGSFHTDFNLAESPLSENGAWTNVGLDWTSVVSANGRAYGTHSGSGFADSYAFLSGFPADVEVSAVIYLDSSISADYHEVEIWLRAANSPHNARGYECNLNYSGNYAEVVRWNGPLGNFTYLGGGQGAGGGHKPVSGSVFKARIQGNVIKTYLDGVLMQTVDITAVGSGSVWTDGQPGMGFYNGGAGKYGFTSYSATPL